MKLNSEAKRFNKTKIYTKFDKRRRDGVESALNEINNSDMTSQRQLHQHARVLTSSQTQEALLKDIDGRAGSMDVNLVGREAAQQRNVHQLFRRPTH